LKKQTASLFAMFDTFQFSDINIPFVFGTSAILAAP
jgi:hypothetical protein